MYRLEMSRIEEIEKAIEQLPSQDFVILAGWVERRRQDLKVPGALTDQRPLATRDHSAFLSSYAPEDEGLYDDATAG